MLDRNHRLVEAAEVLLAVYNGERRGGTAATIRYARKMGRQIVILDPISLKSAVEQGRMSDYCSYIFSIRHSRVRFDRTLKWNSTDFKSEYSISK